MRQESSGSAKGWRMALYESDQQQQNILKQYNMFNIKIKKEKKKNLQRERTNCYIYRHNDSGIYSDT